MEIEIKQLCPELVDDYIEYFHTKAFSDHSEWSGCFCLHFHLDERLDALYKEFLETAEESDLSFSQSTARELVLNGTIQGYLAYHNESVIGWCNTNDKLNYSALKTNVDPENWEEDNHKKIKSVVCFSVAPGFRGKGVASKLLERVCHDAKEQKYDWVEGYPQIGSQDVYINHHGPESLFYQQGFITYRSNGNQAVVRKLFK